MKWFPILALVLAGCLDKDDDDTSGDGGAADGGATDGGGDGGGPDDFSDCTAADGDATDITGVHISGDVLTVGVGYSGGCEPHDFTVCWPDQAFAQSEPVQAMLEVWHDAHGDSCEAYITEDVTFDLVPLQEAWVAAYGGTSGNIIVNLGGYSALYAF